MPTCMRCGVEVPAIPGLSDDISVVCVACAAPPQPESTPAPVPTFSWPRFLLAGLVGVVIAGICAYLHCYDVQHSGAPHLELFILFLVVGAAVCNIAKPHSHIAAVVLSVMLVLAALAVSEYALTRELLLQAPKTDDVLDSHYLEPMIIWQITWKRLLSTPVMLGVECLCVFFTAFIPLYAKRR